MKDKTYAIITDIHSNLESLKSSLAIIEEHGDFDQLICLGDCFALGPEPEKTLKILQDLKDCIFIRGNHDRYLIERLWEDENPTLEGMDPNDSITKAIVQNEKWTADQVGDQGTKFCKKMKIAHREIVGNTLIEFSHAWFKRDEKPPSVTEALKWRDQVVETNPNIEKIVFVHGHVHVPRNQTIENLTILCQGAIGLPFDRDPRGAVAFLTVSNNQIDWNVKRYEYDINVTAKKLDERKPPFYKNLKNTLKFASIRNDL
jgi:predicted phosphodiesterase